MKVFQHLDRVPVIPPSCYIDPSARINGDVVMGENCSVWFNASIRGDVHRIRIGQRTNIQDNCVLHTTTDLYPLQIGDDVTMGHSVVVHGCEIGNQVMIGIGSIILDEAIIEDRVLIGAGSLVTPGKRIPSGVLAFGRPARVIRDLTEAEMKQVMGNGEHYVAVVEAYRARGMFHGWKP